MKKVFAMMAVLIILTASAQEAITLGEIIIPANPEAQISNPDTEVYTFTGESLEKKEELDEFLGSRNSSIFNTVGRKGESNLNLRGFDLTHVNVLLDGVPVSIPYEGSIDPGKLSLASIKKIEVVQGASSVLAGPNALGGTINIITDKPLDNYGTINANYWGRKGSEVRASVHGAADDFFYGLNTQFTNQSSLSLSNDFDTEAFAPQPDRKLRLSDREKNNYYMIVGNRKENSQTAFRVSSFREKYGVPIDLSSNRIRYWRFNHWEKEQYSLEGNIHVPRQKTNYHYNIFRDKYYNVLDSYDDDTLSSQNKGYAFHSTYDDYSHGINLKSETQINDVSQIAGMLYFKKDVHRSQGDEGDAWENYRADYKMAALEYRGTPRKDLSWSTGISHTEHSPKDADGNTLPVEITALDYTFSIEKEGIWNGAVYGNFGKKTRFPSLKERFSGYLDRNIPNPDLEEETGRLVTIGYRTDDKNGHRYDFSLFSNRLSDAIMLVQITTGANAGKEQNQNVGKVTYQGAEFTMSGTHKRLSFKLGFTYNDVVNKSYSREVIVDYTPLHRATANLTYEFNERTNMGVDLSYTGDYHYEADSTAFAYVKEDSRILADMSLAYDFDERATVYVKARNLTDNNYISNRGFYGEGRNYELGVNITFN